MYEVRRPSFWAKAWVEELIALPRLPVASQIRSTQISSRVPPRSQEISGGIERYQLFGGMATYAALGIQFVPADRGLLKLEVPAGSQTQAVEYACFGLSNALPTLARELGPGTITLTHLRSDPVDSSPAAFAIAATALAFVLARPEAEIREGKFVQRPCQFHMQIKTAAQVPESLVERTSFTGTILSGPFLKGDLRIGDEIQIEGPTEQQGEVVSFPLMNFGSKRSDWVAVEVQGIEPMDPTLDTTALGPVHWRPASADNDDSLSNARQPQRAFRSTRASNRQQIGWSLPDHGKRQTPVKPEAGLRSAPEASTPARSWRLRSLDAALGS